jgi:uncharacterized protein (DUF1800 family)
MQFIQAPITALLCLSLLSSSVPDIAQAPAAASADPSSRPKARSEYRPTQLRGDDRILHALNRFTFGPRPGDLESLRAIDLDKWFDQQLHPNTIDESVLDARLAQYPAMQLSPQDLLFRLPSNAVIRQAINGRGPVPERGFLHAVYQNQIDRVTARQQEQQLKKAADQSTPQIAKTPAMAGETTMDTTDGEKAETPTPMAKEPVAAGESQPRQLAMPAANPVPAEPPADEALIRDVLALPPQQRLARLADMRQPELEAFLKSLRPGQRAQLAAGLEPAQKEQIEALAGPERLVVEELIAQRLTRDIYSNAQLQEVMTDFWLNHFNVYLRKNEATPYYLVSYERDVIRPLALGKFEDLLEATAHSPAMLLYLDNAESMGPDSVAAERAKENAWRRPNAKKQASEGLNENYARELMELHTLGVNGGYTQADVTQVARILTGWTIDRPERGGSFQFNPNRHEPGTKKVMGQKFKDNGEEEGRELLHFLATRPATARFISRELAIRLVSDDPPQALVDHMARTYMTSGGDIPAVLKTLFHSPEFWSASAYRAKVKTPLEFVISAVRAGNANIDNLRPVPNALREMGMPVYGCVPPTGYSWQSSTWVSTGALVDRMNFALALAANRLPDITVTWDATPNSSSDPAVSPISLTTPYPQSEEHRLESLLVSGGVSDSTRSAVLQQFQQQSAQDLNAIAAQPLATRPRQKLRAQEVPAVEKQDQILAGLLLGSPEFQRR